MNISNHKFHTNYNKNYDALTGLIGFEYFKEKVKDIVDADQVGVENEKYSFIYLDVLRFKVINDIFGVEEGDKLLIYISESLKRLFETNSIITRINSDRFAVFSDKVGDELEKIIEKFLKKLSEYELSYEIVSNIGIYLTKRAGITAQSMLDRAILAHSTVKGDYITKYAYYTSSLRDAILGEHEITGVMNEALEKRQFVVYYQPQYNHVDRSIVGAEALVRWVHPKRGLISPGKFIPIFEKNGFITKVDLYVFEEVCSFIRRCLDKDIKMVPISVNISRRDIYHPNLAQELENIRKKYNVPTELVRLEVTESVMIDGLQRINDFINDIHKFGYVVEMDDFGSAYSSLNALKSIDLDVLKLDMKFLADEGNANNGTIILSSIVRMAKWLGFPIIAEGVEHKEQADFLLSIGTCYIQGFLYAKPMPEEDFLSRLNESEIALMEPAMNLMDSMNADSFWDPKSAETMIFSNFVGGAAIYEYKNGRIELLRVNNKYVQEIGTDLNEEDIWQRNFLSQFDEQNRRIYIDMLERAIKSNSEAECETWRNYTGNSLKNVCIRTSVKVIGKSIDSVFFYSMVRNITAEKHAMEEVLHREMMFRSASEQMNIYYWEYEIETKKMYPCFRCMRDFKLPDVVENYPEPLIESGILPPEIAETYRELMRKIDDGEKDIEIVIPLTSDRIMFKVRYSTQLDENGKPVKAYGSAVAI